jgi:hypothetical protein
MGEKKKVSEKVSVPAIVENDCPFKHFVFSVFSHRHHEQPHHAPNAFMAQLKFSSRM